MVLVTLSGLCVGLSAAQQSLAGFTLARDQCSLVPRPLDTLPEAQAVISTLIDLSQPGNGVFGCGAPVKGKQAAEQITLTEYFLPDKKWETQKRSISSSCASGHFGDAN